MEIRSEIQLKKQRVNGQVPQITSECYIIQKKQQMVDCQKISNYHSEYLQHRQQCQQPNKKQYMPKLYLLLLKFKLQQMGFRKYDYQKYISQIEINQLSLNKVQEKVTKICQKIIQNQQSNSLRIVTRLKSQTIQEQPINKKKKNQIIKKQYIFVCSVCCQQIIQSQLSVYLKCKHNFCDTCITGTIQQSIRQAKYQFTCLQIHCQAQMTQQLIQKALTPQKWAKYIYFKKKKQLQSDPNNKFCTKPNCEGILQTIENKKLCYICKTQYCNTCLKTSHTGDCQSHLQNIIEQVYTNLKIKKCPKCKSPIQKSDGCNHMTCKKCCFEFCWICLGSYSKYHFRYFNCFGCPGMQFQEEQDKYKQRFKQVIFFILLPFIIVAILSLIIMGMPIYMIIMILMRAYTKSVQYNGNCCFDSCCSCCQCYESWQCCCDCFQDMYHWGCKCLIMFLVYLPQGILYGIFVAPFKYIAMIYYELFQVFD